LEMNGIYGDPLFENLASGNLELSDSSPAIDNGMLIQGFNDTYSAWPAQGLGPDMGAFEKR